MKYSSGYGGNSYFYYYIPQTIRNVTITVQTAIPDYAFRNCSFIESITIPSNAGLGYYAFAYCSGLDSIALNGEIGYIMDYAFYGCTSLKNVYITDLASWCQSNIYSRPAYANNLYLNGELVTELIIPEGVTSIGTSAFANYTSITSVTIPSTVTSIGYYAFDGCTNIVRINSDTDGELIIPNGVTSIGEYAFRSLENITKVVVSDTVTSIGSHAFEGCNSIEDITLPFIGQTATSTSGVLGHLFSWTYRSNDSEVVEGAVYQDYYSGYGGNSYCYYYIPQTIKKVTITVQTAIPNYAFRNCSFIESITIPSNAGLGYYAFAYCSGLDSIALNGEIGYIMDYAFYGCTSLKNVYITDLASWCQSNIYSRPAYANNLYLNGELVTELIIPEGVTSIGTSAFANYTSITSVTIPSTVTSIGYYAFDGCTNIVRINSDTDGELIIPNGVTSIGEYAFRSLENITKVVVPNTVTTIGNGAFEGCNSIEDITLPFVGKSASSENCVFGSIFGSTTKSSSGLVVDGAIYQDYYSYYGGTSYYYYYIPKTIRNVTITSQTAIPNYAFRNCSFIETITVKSNTSFGIDALNNCNATIKYI